MIIEQIGTGKTVEEATQAAKMLLKAPAYADVKVEVLDMGKKGFLFFKGTDAKVKASYDDGKKQPKAPKKQAAKKPAEKKPAEKKPVQKKSAPVKEKKETPKTEQKKDYPKSVDLEYAKSYLMTILKGFNIEDVKLEASYNEGVVTLDVDCNDYGIIIGRRGDTLDSLQYLLSLAMKRNTSEYVRVVINVGNYREKRNETLRNLASKHAAYVLRTGRRFTFEPMNPYERRIIHTTIQEIEGVESRSIGNNQDRKVVLEPVGGVKRSSKDNRRGSNNRQAAVTKAPENHVPKADRADLPKFGKIEVNKD